MHPSTGMGLRDIIVCIDILTTHIRRISRNQHLVTETILSLDCIPEVVTLRSEKEQLELALEAVVMATVVFWCSDSDT